MQGTATSKTGDSSLIGSPSAASATLPAAPAKKGARGFDTMTETSPPHPRSMNESIQSLATLSSTGGDENTAMASANASMSPIFQGLRQKPGLDSSNRGLLTDFNRDGPADQRLPSYGSPRISSLGSLSDEDDVFGGDLANVPSEARGPPVTDENVFNSSPARGPPGAPTGSDNRNRGYRHRLHGAWDPPEAPTEIGASGVDTEPEATSPPVASGGFFASPPATRGPPVAPTKLPPPAGRR